MKALTLYVYKNGNDDFSNGGITSRFDTILIESDEGYIDIDENNIPDNFCKVVERQLFGKTYKHIEPYNRPDKGCVGWMSGGCFAYSCDNRYRKISDYPLAIHDRQETQAQYDAMTND